MLDDRKARILQVLVEEFIRTGEPVSSRAVLDRAGLDVSSATIRNDFAKLESYGFVEQPHSSAGRVPTSQGYRYYVDHCSPARLRATTRARIEAFFSGMHSELSRLLKETSGLLSDITHYPAVVLGPGLGSETIVALHLIPLGSKVVLAVMVGESGRVTREVVRLPHPPSESELMAAEQHLHACFGGRSVADGDQKLEDIIATLPEGVAGIIKQVAATLRRSETETRDLYLGGTSQLADLWQDLAHVQRILFLLEQETAIRAMVGRDNEGTTVRIGSELEFDDVDLAVVATTYEAGDHGAGRVAVLGPMRMDYRRTIKVVEEVGEGLADSLGS